MIPAIEDIFHSLSRGEMTFSDAEMYVREHMRLRIRIGHRLDKLQLRDMFAGRALQGMLSRGDSARFTSSELAEIAYRMADTMLAERAKK